MPTRRVDKGGLGGRKGYDEQPFSPASGAEVGGPREWWRLGEGPLGPAAMWGYSPPALGSSTPRDEDIFGAGLPVEVAHGGVSLIKLVCTYYYMEITKKKLRYLKNATAHKWEMNTASICFSYGGVPRKLKSGNLRWSLCRRDGKQY